MHQVNLFASQFEYDEADPRGYRAGMARVGEQVGSQELSIKLFELPPGESLCPYHYEYVEEWMLVLAGEVTVRVPDGETRAEAGCFACFAAGPEGAHKLSNRGSEPARVLMFSSAREPAVAVYPDSDKIGVWPGRKQDTVMLRRGAGQVPYYDGEV